MLKNIRNLIGIFCLCFIIGFLSVKFSGGNKFVFMENTNVYTWKEMIPEIPGILVASLIFAILIWRIWIINDKNPRKK